MDMRPFLSILMAELLVSGLLMQPAAFAQNTTTSTSGTVTPIQHLVVIFDENISFDHYFGTYPNATNPQGEPVFKAVEGTPTVNGLSGALLTVNPNLNTANGAGATNPFRLDRSQAATTDQNHNYTPEETALHGGLVDLYPSSTGTAGGPPDVLGSILVTTGINMGYFDGNTVTALWNYAQHYAMSDNSYDTSFGPSTPGALNLISGQLNGAVGNVNGTSSITNGGSGSTTAIGDADPVGDVCSTTTGEAYSMTGTTIGDLLNAKAITWGFYTQGFDLGVVNANGTTGCKRSTTSLITNTNKADYIPHHAPFQYYKSTQNLTHARPTSVSTVGQTDAANHQYDMHDFYDAINSGNFPAVNFLKAPGYQDGHAGYSDPLDEQTWIVNVINFLQNSGYWNNTAVVIAYDDSDGWYDHQMPPIVNQSNSPADVPGFCGTGANALPGVGGVANAQGRCGYGPRMPLLVISPWSKTNFVDHTITDLTSIIRFVEDNWLEGQRIGSGSFDGIANSIQNMMDFTHPSSNGKLILDPTTGEVTSSTASVTPYSAR
jgi:phospholipase C